MPMWLKFTLWFALIALAISWLGDPKREQAKAQRHYDSVTESSMTCDTLARKIMAHQRTLYQPKIEKIYPGAKRLRHPDWYKKAVRKACRGHALIVGEIGPKQIWLIKYVERSGEEFMSWTTARPENGMDK